ANELFVREAVPVEDGLHVLVALRSREEEMLDGDVVVLQTLRFVLGLIEEGGRSPPEARLCAAGNARELVDAFAEICRELASPRAGALDQRAAHSALLFEDGDQDMFGDQLGIAASSRDVRSEEHTSELQSRENLVCR